MLLDVLYILKDRQPVKCKYLDEWNAFMREQKNRTVEVTTGNGIKVSTLFLGVEHTVVEGPPILFESMILGGYYHLYKRRCSTWAEAEAQHRLLVRKSIDRANNENH